MKQPQIGREVIKERALAQPRVEHGEILTEEEALAFFEDVRQNNFPLFENIQALIESKDKSLADKLGDKLTPLERRGVIAHVAIASAMQMLSDTGQSIVEVEAFKRSLGIETEHIPVISDGM